MTARVRFLSRVQTHVSFQMVITSEPFMANFAFERFLAGMRSLVVLQDVFVAEATVASFASENFVFAVIVARGRATVGSWSRGRGLSSAGGRGNIFRRLLGRLE